MRKHLKYELSTNKKILTSTKSSKETKDISTTLQNSTPEVN